MNKTLRLSTLAMALACSFAVFSPMQVQATGLIAGATEPTQIANNIELAASLVEQATTAAATVAAKITLAQQYLTMLQNIKNLPQNMLNELSKPYKDQIKALQDLQTSVKDLKSAAENTRAMFASRGQDFATSGKSLNDYLKFEVALADKKGGEYKKRMDQDIAAMDSMREKAKALRATAEKTSSITGAVQGLQHLSQLSTMQAGELMEIKAALLGQSAYQNSDRAEAEVAKKNKAVLMGAMVKGAKERSDRDKNVNFKVGEPFDQNWKGLETQR